jgi:hypothetical protein
MSLISTTTIQLDRSLYAFYSTFLSYCKNNLSPLPIVWTTIEGYFPGFELQQQIKDAPATENVLMASTTMLLKPISIELESKVNTTWRQITAATDSMAARFYTPVINLPDANLRTKFQMYHGTFELFVSSYSPLYSQDLQLRFWGIFNNRYTYLPTNYNLVIPLQIVNQNDPSLFQELIQQPQIVLAYMPSTGVTQYYINVNIKPMFKLTSSAYSINEMLYNTSYNFEFLAQIPTTWLFWTGDLVNYVNVQLQTPTQSLTDYLAALVNPNSIGFVPRGSVQLQSLESTLTLPNFQGSMNSNFVYNSLTISASGTQPVQTVVFTELIDNLFTVNVTITDSNYTSNSNLLESQPVIFYYGFNRS